MRFYYSDSCMAHDPHVFFRAGRMMDHPETAERAAQLQGALLRAGYEAGAVRDFGRTPLEAVHTPDYLEFLANFWPRRGEIDGDQEEYIATQFARPQMHHRPEGLLGQLGYYTADTSTALRAGTWTAVYGAAQTALSAAADVRDGLGAAYALCRPPGHHAYRDSAGGFCYLNNSAIAAQYLRDQLDGPVAILDVDVHHGNGTQGIFYERGDMLTLSLHADTSNYFPFFSGYTVEKGQGAGLGANHNMPLPHHTGDAAYLAALDKALATVQAFQPRALVVALGLDAAVNDPLGVLDITRDGFHAIGRAIGQRDIPTVLVQEGGYLTPDLPLNLLAFLQGFESAPRHGKKGRRKIKSPYEEK